MSMLEEDLMQRQHSNPNLGAELNQLSKISALDSLFKLAQIHNSTAAEIVQLS